MSRGFAALPGTPGWRGRSRNRPPAVSSSQPEIRLEGLAVDGAPLAEVADRLEASPVAAKSLVRRARSSFRMAFERAGRGIAGVLPGRLMHSSLVHVRVLHADRAPRPHAAFNRYGRASRRGSHKRFFRPVGGNGGMRFIMRRRGPPANDPPDRMSVEIHTLLADR